MVVSFGGFLLFPCTLSTYSGQLRGETNKHTYIQYSDTHSSQSQTPTVDVHLPGTLWTLSLTGSSSYSQQLHHIHSLPHVEISLHAIAIWFTIALNTWFVEQSHGMVDEATPVMSPLNPRITVCRVYNAACNGWKDTGHTITKMYHMRIDHSAGLHFTCICTLQCSQQRCGGPYCGFSKALHVMEGIPQDLLLFPCHHVCTLANVALTSFEMEHAAIAYNQHGSHELRHIHMYL